MLIKKLYAVLKTEGIRGILIYAYYRVFPQRLQYYAQCKSMVESGVGLEIGGPSRIFGASGCLPFYPVAVQVDNCNFGAATVWEGSIDEGRTFKFSKNRAPGRQFVAEASDLSCIETAYYDFVLSSHCIEHLANPLRGLTEWIRVLKPGGLIVLVFPHRDGTFDHRRPVTPLSHLIDDFSANTGEDDLTHLDEVLELHDFDRSPGVGDFQAFKDRSLRNQENRCLHHHVFDTCLAVEVVNHVGLQILAVELFHPFHIAVVASKPKEQGQAANNTEFGSLDAGLVFG